MKCFYILLHCCHGYKITSKIRPYLTSFTINPKNKEHKTLSLFSKGGFMSRTNVGIGLYGFSKDEFSMSAIKCEYRMSSTLKDSRRL